MAAKNRTPQTTPTTPNSPISESGSISDTGSAPDTTSQQSYTNSELPKSDSNVRWRQPKTVRNFASQVNAVATKVLNGEIDMDAARTYATLTRVLAQAISVEVTRARFLKEAPDLTIGDDWTEEE